MLAFDPPHSPLTLWYCAARSEGGSGRGRRAERGSPSRSNEVISPEILKMRAALFCIFTYLDTRTLLHAAEVCRDWRFVARHPAVWTRVLLENARVCSKVPVSAPCPRPPTHPCCELTSTPHLLQHMAPPGLVFATLTTPQLLPGFPKCSHGTAYPGGGPPPASQAQTPHPQVTPLSLQFLAMLAQWCTQAHSLTLQNLKPRQRNKKESKEEYARNTR